jgi:hypothetical protein
MKVYISEEHRAKLAADLKNIHGLDAEDELSKIFSHEADVEELHLCITQERQMVPSRDSFRIVFVKKDNRNGLYVTSICATPETFDETCETIEQLDDFAGYLQAMNS